MKFTKMHGTGNDYIYIDARQMDEDWPALSRAMSDRHFGIGGDGIILVLDSDTADLRMRMFNADGSEGEMCGNGIRCFAKYAIERNIARPGDSGLSVETLAGIRTIVPRMEGNRVVSARVAMGEPRFNPAEVPVLLENPPERTLGAAVLSYPVDIDGCQLSLSFVSMGNPHAVAFIDQPVEDYSLHSIGPKVEHHPMFPRRVNFEIVNLVDPGHANVRVWERGSGETLACGSGASAVAAIARLMEMSRDTIDITLPGGTLSIEWDGNGEVFMEGPAEEVFSGEW